MANVLTTLGEQKITDLIDGTGAVHWDIATAKIAWGTGAGTAVKGDGTTTGIALFTEASEARIAPAAVTQPVADKIQWVGTMTCAGAGKTITNAGLFDAAGSNLCIHGDFTGVVLAVGDKIEFTITLEQT